MAALLLVAVCGPTESWGQSCGNAVGLEAHYNTDCTLHVAVSLTSWCSCGGSCGCSMLVGLRSDLGSLPLRTIAGCDNGCCAPSCGTCCSNYRPVRGFDVSFPASWKDAQWVEVSVWIDPWEQAVRKCGSPAPLVLAFRGSTDPDLDGILDCFDNCPKTANPQQLDWDGDELGDLCDNCPLVSNVDQEDADADAVGDRCDNCPETPNEGQDNGDSDSHGDACDNCPNHANPDQADCDLDGTGDLCAILVDGSEDCQDGGFGDGVPDECQLVRNDCNENLRPDECDINTGTSDDCQDGGFGDGVPDECQLVHNDCNTNTVPDDCDIDEGTSSDCQPDGIPDECSLDVGRSRDCNTDRIPDECQLADNDCDANSIPDDCELDRPRDLNGDSVVDLADYRMLIGCLVGLSESVPAPDCGFDMAALAELDADGVVTLSDVGLLQLSFGTHMYFDPDCCTPSSLPCERDTECCSGRCKRGDRECR